MKVLSSVVSLASLFGLLAAVPKIAATPFTSLALPYVGTKVLRVPTGPSPKGLKDLKDLIKELNLSTWTAVPVVSSHVDLEVPADKYDQFMAAARGIVESSGAIQLNFEIEVMHEDLGESILAESEGMDSPVYTQAGLANNAWFNSYHPYADHITWLNDLVATFPNNSRLVSTGTSVQGRPLQGVNIYGSDGPNTKPAIIWHGTVHAREWIATMVTEYLAYSLLNNYANSTEVKGYVDKYDIYIFPLVNPDGFVFTQTNTRLWRKNRSPPPSGSTCYGRDINRNWNVVWSQTGGASTSPCSETYKGQAPADTPEAAGLQAFLNARASSPNGAKLYIDFHSYGQLFMSPYGYTCTQTPPDVNDLTSLGNGFANAVRAVHGTRLTVGPACQTLYQTSGTSRDYSYVNSRIKYSYTNELRDTGSNGFVLPPNQIRPSGEETWAGVRYLLANLP